MTTTANDAADPGASLVSITPGLFQGFSQPQTIVGIVSGPVNSVTVVGNGAISCTGTYGTIVGYDADGTQLGSQPMGLIDPADCSPDSNPDNVTFGAQGTLTVSSGIIARFEIQPMSPLAFPVFDLVGHASATYTISLGVAASLEVNCGDTPMRGTPVECAITMSDGSEFTITHLKSTAGGSTLVDQDVNIGPATEIQWEGIAAVPTSVEVKATAGGASQTGTASFGVQTRIGAATGWIEPDAPDFPAAAPAPKFVGGAPLSSPYPGIFPKADGGYDAAEGALGITYFVYPTGGKTHKISSGPNTGVKYVLSVDWKVDPASGGTAPAIYVELSLQPGDPFYTRQIGPSPFCTLANMLSLRTLILTHENLHWTSARAAMQPLKTQTVFEGLTELPGGQALGVAFEEARKQYVQTMTQANSGVESSLPVGSNAPVCDMRP